MKILNKIKFFFKKPKVVVVAGRARKTVKEAILRVLENYFKIGSDILVLEKGELKFSLGKASLPILVATHVGEYHPGKEFFAGELSDVLEVKNLAQNLPSHSYLILNFDDETVRDIKNISKAHPLTFGLGARADIKASDIVLTQAPGLGTNFKVNYQGNIVPVWLEQLFGKEHVYAALAAVTVGQVLGLNLVEISTALKSYQGVAGKMKLIKGIKSSWILDDSENASSLSTLEALETLKKLPALRKIAVLGDILDIGKYSIEAHYALGEEAANSANLLFAVGPRAKFFAQGAKTKGMPAENIFEFNDSQEVARVLQDKIEEGDLVLVDGSKEMQMGELVKEIKA